MTHIEKVELLLIALTGISIGSISTYLPKSVGFGRLLLAVSALLLLQSLIRDIWSLIQQKHVKKTETKTIMRCMCVESTIGITGVVIGIMMLGSGFERSLALKDWAWSIVAVAVLLLGFLIKDYVMELKPFRLRKNKDHHNIIVKWGK